MGNAVAARIRELREARGWSQRELARRLGNENNRAAVFLWESGGRMPTRENILKLANTFVCDVADLDPEGQAWSAEMPRRRRLTKQSHNSDTTPVAQQPPHTAGVDMGTGDPLFAQVEGAWKLLRSDRERRAFVDCVRGFVHQSTASPTQAVAVNATSKKAGRR